MSGCIAKIAGFERELTIAQRHIGAGLHGGLAFGLSNFVCQLALNIVGTAIFAITSYWMIGFARQADAFFLYWWCFVVVVTMTTGVALFFTALGGKKAGTGITGFSLLIGITAGGTFLTKLRLPEYFRYFFYYLTPVSYAVRSMLVTEYTSPAYDAVVQGGRRYGSLLMSGLDLDFDAGIHYGGPWYPFGAGLAFTLLCAVLLGARKRPAIPAGTPRPSAVIPGYDAKAAAARSLDMHNKAHGGSSGADASAVAKAAADASASPAVVAATAVAPSFAPITLAWSKLSYSDGKKIASSSSSRSKPLKSAAAAQQKYILSGVSGLAFPGTLTAVVTHGHGVTQRAAAGRVGRALLTLLAKRPTKAAAAPEASITANGQQLTPELAAGRIAISYNDGEPLYLALRHTRYHLIFSCVVGKRTNNKPTSRPMHKTHSFCADADPLHPFETVEEALHVSARMRMHRQQAAATSSSSTSSSADEGASASTSPTTSDVSGWVRSVLHMCELEGVAGMTISALTSADPAALARARIAVELASNPSVLLVEDPMAAPSIAHNAACYRSVMRTLRRIADSGRTVIVTLHSASSDAIASGHPESIVLMTSPNDVSGAGSRVVFSGSPRQLRAHLESAPAIAVTAAASVKPSSSAGNSSRVTASDDDSVAKASESSVDAVAVPIPSTSAAGITETVVDALASAFAALSVGDAAVTYSVDDEEEGATSVVSPAGTTDSTSAGAVPLAPIRIPRPLHQRGKPQPLEPLPPYATSFATQCGWAAVRQLRYGMRNLELNRCVMLAMQL